MTIASDYAPDLYAGNDLTYSFAFTFPVLAKSELVVTRIDDAGVETVQVENTNYQITNWRKPGDIGTVSIGYYDGPTWTNLPIPVGEQIRLSRVVAYTQPTDLTNNQRYLAESVERGLDRLEMQIQQIAHTPGIPGPPGPPGGVTIHDDLTGRSTADQHPATAITYTPAGGISATTVQAAINELDTEKVATTDARLTDARTPTAHVSTHAPSGSDPIPWTTAHGRGLASARPAAAATNAGYIYFSTDTLVLERSTGSVWESIGSSATVTLATDREVNATEPPASSDSRLRTPFALNYILNPDAEIDTTGWSTYADAAGTQPVDGTGGSPSTTWARYNGTSKRGGYNFLLTANAQGEGASYNFTIDSADKNRSLTVSGFAYVGGSTASDVVSLWVYDVTNARLCPISGGNSILATGAFALQFAASDSTSYRLIVHVHKASPGGATVQLDDFYVGPAYLPSAPAMSDWQDGGAITITATTTNPTKGTTTRDKVWWRRVGDSAEIRFEYKQTGAGAAGSGDYLITLPAGMSVDTAKANATAAAHPDEMQSGVGVAHFTDASSVAVGCVSVYDATRLRVVAQFTSGTIHGGTVWASGHFPLSAASLRVSGTLIVPIAGWSGTTAVQAGSRYLWAQRFAANATRVTTTPSKPGEYRARRLTTDTAPTTAPSAADGFRIDAGSGIAAGRINQYDIYIGPGKVVQLTPHLNAGRTGGLLHDFYITGGGNVRGIAFTYDPVTGLATAIASTGTASDAVGNTADLASQPATGYFDLLVADDPVPVALAPAVHVEASSDAGQVVTGGTTNLQYEDEAIDTHGSWSIDTFSPPVPGRYLLEATVQVTAAVAQGIQLLRNGTVFRYGPTSDSSANSVGGAAFAFTAYPGETYTVRAASSGTRNTTAGSNKITITRIGDA